MSNEIMSSETIEQILNQVLTNGTRLEEISDRLTELAGRLDVEFNARTQDNESAADQSEAANFDALDADQPESDQAESGQFLEDLKMQDSVEASEFADSFADSEEPLDSAQSLLDSLVSDDDSAEPEIVEDEFGSEEDLTNSNDTSLDELNAVFGDTISTPATEDETDTTEAETETYEVDSLDDTEEYVAAESFLDSSTDETLFSEQTDESSNSPENGDNDITEETPEVSKSVESVRNMLAGLMNDTDADVSNEEVASEITSDADAAFVEATVVTDNSGSEPEEAQEVEDSDSEGVASFLERFTSESEAEAEAESEAKTDQQDSQTLLEGEENSSADDAAEEDSNVEALRKELEDKLRKAEIEMSIERARISQKAAELEEKQLVLEQKERSIQNGSGEISDDGGTTENRWFRHMSASRKKED